MAGRRKSVGPVNYHELPRRKLQSLCKKYGFPANKTNVAMADALTALLNAPERLASGIDSPAVSSKSSYLSSSDVEESPMISPGVDSLPTISESRPEVFEGLRITKLPEIMEMDTSPPEEVMVNTTEEMGSVCKSDEKQTSIVTDSMTNNSAPGVSSHSDSSKGMDVHENKQELFADDSSPGSGRELNRIGCSDIMDVIIDDFTTTAGPSFEEEGKDMEFSESSQAILAEASETGTVNMECEERPIATFGIPHVGKSECTSEASLEALVSISEITTETQLPVSEEMIESSDRRLDEVTEAVEVSELWPENSTSNEEMMNVSSEDLLDGVTKDSTADELTDQVQMISSSDHVTSGIPTPEPSYETGEAGEGTPIPLSVMPHSSVSDLSVSNKEVASLVTDLNNSGFPRVDLFETGGDTKIASSEAGKSRGGSQGMNIQDTEISRTTWTQDAFGPFKCLNPAALSPKVRRSLGIDIPKAPISRLASFPAAKGRATSEKENEPEFACDLSSVPPVVSLAALAPPTVTDTEMDTQKTSVFHEETSTIQEMAVCLANEETSETTQQISEDEQHVERSESCSPVPGYVKEIVNLLENKSGEESRDSAGASRKDAYKQSALVRSSRLAADIERASRVGHAKRAAVLAGKRSLWPSTNSSSSFDEAEPHIVEGDELQNPRSGSPIRDQTADRTAEHSTDADQVIPPHAEASPFVHTTSEGAVVDTRQAHQQNVVNAGVNYLSPPERTEMVDTGASPQQDEMNPGESVAGLLVLSPTHAGEFIAGEISVSESSPIQTTEMVDTPKSPQQDEMNAGDNHRGLSVLPPTHAAESTEGEILVNDSSPMETTEMVDTPKSPQQDVAGVNDLSPTERTEMVDTPKSPQQDEMNAADNHPGLLVRPTTHAGEYTEGGILVNESSPLERPGDDEETSAEDVVDYDDLTTLSDKTTDAGILDIKYVEIPRPVETNAECGPISELSWIRKATNLPTPKSQKLIERTKRPVSANLRKFELMERAALNAAKKHRTPKRASHVKGEAPDALATLKLSNASDSLESHASTTSMMDVEMEELTPAPVSRSLGTTPDKSAAPLSLRDCNRELGALTVESCLASPKSPAISLDEILRENTLSTDKENLCGKENERLRRHQEEYKTPLTGRSKEKAIRAAEMNAASLREKILKQRRGIEEEEQSNNSGQALKQSLLGRLL